MKQLHFMAVLGVGFIFAFTNASSQNDKSEIHNGKITTAQIAIGEFLEYTIRFQNTGTDTASNVLIKDTLDDKLDWSTFRMIATSHNFQLTINDLYKCNWIFSNIKLVDSNKNVPLSRGFLTYIIKPKSSLVIGDTIKNFASIYFDNEQPVHTNTEKTAVVSNVLPLQLIDFSVLKKGTVNLLSWKTAQAINVSHFEVQRSSDGKDFYAIGQLNASDLANSFIDRVPLSGVNYYRLKIVDKDGKFQYSSVKRAIDNIGVHFSVYPCPAKDLLNLKIETSTASEFNIQVVDQFGRVVMVNKLEISAGTSIKRMLINHLSSGNYSIKLVSKSTEAYTIRFHKQ